MTTKTVTIDADGLTDPAWLGHLGEFARTAEGLGHVTRSDENHEQLTEARLATLHEVLDIQFNAGMARCAEEDEDDKTE